jgi:transposase
MGKSYSEDLRMCVVKYFEEVNDVDEVVRLYGISRNSIYLWRSQYRKLGHIKKKIPRPPVRKLNYEELDKFIQENPDMMQKDVAKLFGVVNSTMSDAFKRLGYCKKKDYNLQRSRSKKTRCIFGTNSKNIKETISIC